jgi:hypothetical protein
MKVYDLGNQDSIRFSSPEEARELGIAIQEASERARACGAREFTFGLGEGVRVESVPMFKSSKRREGVLDAATARC